jgi:SlyX protein
MEHPQPDPASAAQRLTDLEIKLSFTEDVLDRLNDVVVQQQAQIDLLLREVGQMRRQQAGGEDRPGFVSLRDERPPHY